MKWDSLDVYTLRAAVEAEGTCLWRGANGRWSVWQMSDGTCFVLDQRYSWSVDTIRVWVDVLSDGPIWRFRAHGLPAYVKDACRTVMRSMPSYTQGEQKIRANITQFKPAA